MAKTEKGHGNGVIETVTKIVSDSTFNLRSRSELQVWAVLYEPKFNNYFGLNSATMRNL